MSARAPLIASAVTFLRDPSTASSPLAQRIGFLESKGLTPAEIEQALAQANSSAGPVGSYGGPHGMRMQREYERDWRDWFIMAVVGGTVGYVAVKLAQKFIVPHLQPPDETDLEAAQKALEAKYDEASELLKNLQVSTDSLAASLDEQKAAVEKELVEVRKGVEEMREGERRREEWSKKVGEQVDEVVKGLPNLIEKQATSQAQSLTDLQTELKSLKSLLIARRPTPAATSPSPIPPAHPNTPAPGNNVIPPPANPYALPSPSSPITESGRASPSGLGARKPGIPSWQMRGTGAGLAGSQQPLPGSAYQTQSPSVPATAPAPSTAVESSSNVEALKTEDTSASGVLVQKEDAGPASTVPAVGGSAEAKVEEVKEGVSA
ncbi:peroxisomal membrane anchor protein conserved region-domain-containing protein [Leucosporidium creatinivorum]|uniref:Peroxisomal membrane protein PEX14 n=1 Tax=Leucosporidium creatinivorum TaxID=106004 RepID=A0A1Y2D0S2_9BASI|nr:peroxisomal membrane anchor protein conserved region-domain-containing protein [Leucosporidium creatinivorum]